MSPLRIVHVSLGTNLGGMEKLLVEFARLTDRHRYALTFVSLQHRGELADEIESHQCPVLSLDKPEGLRPAVVARLARKLRKIKPDVVHTHNTAGYVYGVASAAIAGVPRIIHTRHGQRFQSSRRQTILFRGLSGLVDHVVSVSSDGRQLSIDEGIAATKATTIWNGVDLQKFDLCVDRPIGRVAVVARLVPEKDIASLIMAIDIMVRQNADVGLDVIGDGSERQTLEMLSQSLGIGDRIRFHGSRDDIPTALANTSVFVLPSITEGISLTLLEAMATGLPVVACRVGGNPEVVDDGKTGFLVAPGQPEDLADALLKLHHNPGLAKQFGSNGRAKVEAKFCARKMVAAYESLYRGEAA